MHVLLPLRSPGRGKTRLHPTLSVEARSRLVAAMLADVVAAVREAELEPTVLASGAAAAAAGTALGCEVQLDRTTAGLNAAIADATSALAPEDAVLVLQADLPLLTGPDVRAMCRDRAEVVMARNDDGGTSALLRRPATVIATAFGPDSAAAHERLARAAGRSLSILERPGLARDLDTVDDLRSLDVARVGPALATVLSDLPL